jgi:nitrate reductase NapE component
MKSTFTVLRKSLIISSSFNKLHSFFFLNQDYAEEDEKDEFKVFLFILFILFSVIIIQKQNEQIGTHMFNVYFLNQAF